MICFVENGSITVAGYRRTLVTCANMEEAIIAVLSVYYVCSIDYDHKQTAASLSTVSAVPADGRAMPAG